MAALGHDSMWQTMLRFIGVSSDRSMNTTGSLLDQALVQQSHGMTQPVVGLLLAAGRGARFDASGQHSKLLAPIDGIPVACHAASRLSESCQHTLAVIRPGADELRTWLERFGCIVVECPDAHSGMGHSLAWGVAHAIRRFDPKALLVMLADMPFISSATIRRVASTAGHPKALTAPTYQGKRGHPVLFGSEWFEALGRSSGDRGAEAVLRNPAGLTLLEVDDPGILRDIDRPEDLPTSFKQAPSQEA
jgi:molybdenum cofactor cytidylyltransferase